MATFEEPATISESLAGGGFGINGLESQVCNVCVLVFNRNIFGGGKCTWENLSLL